MLMLIKLQNSIKKGLNRFVREEDAPTMVEYGLLVVVIALVVVAGAAIFGDNLSSLFEDMGTAIGTQPVTI